MRNSVFVGLDWAYRSHAVCVVDAQGSVLKHLTISHDAQGLGELRHALAAFGKALPIAIERPSGLIVDALVEAGHQVFAIHPNAVKASRPRYRSTNAKSDAGDAYMLADLLRTDGHRWHALQPQSAAIRGLRTLVRTRDDLVATRVRLANQLTALLDAYWPGATCIFAAVDSPIALAFIEQWSTARKLTARQIAAFCKRQGYSGRRSPGVLLDRLQAAAPSLCEPMLAQAYATAALALVALLKPLAAQIKSLDGHIALTMAALPQAISVMSLPRAGCICAARSWPNWVTYPSALPAPSSSAPRLASYPSPTSPARVAPSPSDGLATTACVGQSPVLQTIPAMPVPGQPASTKPRANAAAIIRTQCAYWLVPGLACSGASGPTAPNTTRPFTPAPVGSKTLKQVDTGCLIRRLSYEPGSGGPSVRSRS